MKSLKNKQISALILILLILASFQSYSQSGEKFKVDRGKSLIQWNAQKVTGSHRGVINVKEGYVLVSATGVTGGTVFIDMTSIRNLDISDDQDRAELESHLKSADFFNVKSYPDAVFKVYGIKELKENEDFTHTLEGSLTIKGYTNKLIFPVNIEIKNNKCTIIGETSVDRTKYDIKYRSGKFYDDLGDLMIYDDFNIKFTLVAVLKDK